MARGGTLGCACKLAGVFVLAAMLAACAKSPAAVQTAEGPVIPGTARDFSVNVGDTVYFTTDSTSLSAAAEATLRAQVAWLRRYPGTGVTIAGHADERGTREYNLALGAQRAETVRAFLAANGVSAGRMRTISYGKERPVAVCNDISCWSQNRRAGTQLAPRLGS